MFIESTFNNEPIIININNIGHIRPGAVDNFCTIWLISDAHPFDLEESYENVKSKIAKNIKIINETETKPSSVIPEFKHINSVQDICRDKVI